MSPRRRILVVFAHPAFERSRLNRHLVEALSTVDGITFQDLYEIYPEFDVDPKREQSLLSEHDVIVLQYPMYWYSTPALVKQWLDLVLEHGWAYGENGHALEGKLMLVALTSGGPEAAYQPEGFHGHTIAELLVPMARTATLCGMQFLPPFVAHNAHRMGAGELRRHVADYRQLLEALRDDRLDLEEAAKRTRINANLAGMLRPMAEG